MADKGKTAESAFGPSNLLVTETAERVTVEFDPRQVIGTFKSGKPKVCSTESFQRLGVGGKMMLHVIGKE